MIIRKATIDDVNKILQTTKSAFEIYKQNLKTANPYFNALSESKEDIINQLKEKIIYIAESDDGALLGSIRLSFLTPELAYISRFAVNPNTHNQGVGADLLQKAIDKCREENIVKVSLHTNAKYYKLARYYYGKGFYVNSTTFDRGYIRALFVKDLIDNRETDISLALRK